MTLAGTPVPAALRARRRKRRGVRIVDPGAEPGGDAERGREPAARRAALAPGFRSIATRSARKPRAAAGARRPRRPRSRRGPSRRSASGQRQMVEIAAGARPSLRRADPRRADGGAERARGRTAVRARWSGVSAGGHGGRCTSRTGWTRSAASPIASPCSATAGWWRSTRRARYRAPSSSGLMVGTRSRAGSGRGAAPGPAPPALRVRGPAAGRAVRDVSFDVRAGEILGLAGLMGSGRTETLRAIFGADPRQAGVIELGRDKRPARIRSPRDAVRAGLALVTEDRKAQGLLLPLSVRANLTLARLSALAGRFGFVRRAARARGGGRLRWTALGVRCASVEQPVGELSGGNQQKVVLGRWLAGDCDVLLLDEPTRGVDAAARAEIHRLLRELAAAGQGDRGRLVGARRAAGAQRPHRGAVRGRAGRHVRRAAASTATRSSQAALSGHAAHARGAARVSGAGWRAAPRIRRRWRLVALALVAAFGLRHRPLLHRAPRSARSPTRSRPRSWWRWA